VASASAICRRVITCAAASHIFADDNAAAGSQAPGRPTCTHSHSYEYRQAPKSILNPRTAGTLHFREF
jgi:hypothetical protein